MHSSPSRKTKFNKELIYVLVLIALLLMGAYLLFHMLGSRDIMAYDEARHGVNAYEMLKNEDLIVHTYQGEADDWNLKPPLSYWLIMISYQLFGFTAFALRFHSAVCIFLMLLAVALWTKKRHGPLAAIAALLFLLANYAFYATHAGRTGDADAIYLLFSAIAMLCMLDSEHDPRFLYGSALCFGFAFLAKSFHAFVIPLTCFLYVCFTGGLRRLKWKHYLWLLFFGLLPILPWAVARCLRDGTTFFSAMFQTDVQTRVASEGQEGEWGLWYFYLLRLISNPTAAAGGLLCAIGLRSQMAAKKRLMPRQIGLMLWMAVPVVLFTFSAYKLHHYIFPSLIGLSVAAGWTVDGLYRKAKKGVLFACGSAALAALLLFEIGSNVYMVNTEAKGGTYQTFIAETLDRDFHSDLHVYIQYGEGLTTWSQDDVLRAQFSGDVLCLNGGRAAFEEDEEEAMLIVAKECFDDTMLEYYPVYNESYYLIMLQN